MNDNDNFVIKWQKFIYCVRFVDEIVKKNIWPVNAVLFEWIESFILNFLLFVYDFKSILLKKNANL